MSIIGIDLGTTNSLVAVMGDHQPRVLANELGEHLTPSAVAVAKDGVLLVGRSAKDRLVVDPSSGWTFFKRDMGTHVRRKIGRKSWSPTECSAAILRELKRIAESHLGSKVERAVISVPAYFHDTQRLATIAAAELAELRVERLINEPTAAALAYGYARSDQECQVLALDLGGGTFDVTLLEIFEGIIEVKASGGDSRLGGEDYTDALLSSVSKRLGKMKPQVEARLRQQLEVAKRVLSVEGEAQFEHGGRVIGLDRAGFEEAGRSLTDRLRPIVRRCLRDAGVSASDLDDVLLVGGASRMPLMTEFLRKELGRPPNRTLDPDRVVALGAAVQAAACDRHEAVRDVVLTDVCPHTLGVEISKQYGDRRIEDGYFSPIIDRNVTVPVSREETYHTFHAKQDSIELNIYQGESRKVTGNTLLGSLTVKGLAHRRKHKRPGQIDVRFTYDMNGILEVEVTVPHSGEVLRKVIESRPGTLSKSEVAEALRRLKPIKTRPRDLFPARARLERANRLFRELTGSQRAQLESCVDAYEDALERDDAEGIRFQAALLDEFLHPFFRAEGEDQSGGEEG